LLQVVNVLDEVHNPGLRETIKTFSQWPTIPQAGSTATPYALMTHL
jgi:glutaredoxin-related protein